MKKMINVRSISIAALLVVLGLGVPVFAHGGDHSTTSTSGHGGSSSPTTSHETEAEHGTETEVEVEHTAESSGSSSRSLNSRVEDKKIELRSAIEDKRQSIKTKLDTTRLKKCQEHENKINTVIGNSKTRGQRVLEKLQGVEAKVREFYQKKNLTVGNYDTLSGALDEKEAAAIAAVSVTGDTQFLCGDDDASRPGGIVSDTVKTQHTALKAYRDAIRDLIKAVKQAAKPQTEETNS